MTIAANGSSIDFVFLPWAFFSYLGVVFPLARLFGTVPLDSAALLAAGTTGAGFAGFFPVGARDLGPGHVRVMGCRHSQRPNH